MTYSIQALARLAGISARSLRHYDEIGLLSPPRAAGNGYRVYGEAELDRLQQILFFRALGVPLAEIGRTLDTGAFDRLATLEAHLAALTARRAQLARLIKTVKNTIAAAKGEITMQDEEKFEGLKETLVRENEARYGAEVRARYGGEAVDASKEKFMHQTAAQFEAAAAQEAEIKRLLAAAVQTGDPKGARSREVCALHKAWLCHHWPSYSPEAHRGLAETYVADERFRAYYDEAAPGGAEFLRDALHHFLASE